MKLLIIGNNGQLGWELSRLGPSKNFECLGFDRPAFDMTSSSHVQSLFDGIGEAIVINAAAYTAVDKAESDRSTALAVNATGPWLVASACQKAKVPVIHISTDYVFDGEKKTDYNEEDPVSPICVYGESKAKGEANVRELAQEHLIIRTAWLYSVHGHNFVKTMLQLGKDREELKVVSDQFGCPTDAMDLAEAILKICCLFRDKKTIPWGTYHFCGDGATSWYGFAQSVFQIAKIPFELKVQKVTPIPSKDYPTAARRPRRSVLDCSKVEAVFDLKRRPWLDSLKDMLIRLRCSSSATEK